MSKKAKIRRRKKKQVNKVIGFLFMLSILFMVANGETSLADVEPDVVLSTETYSENVAKYKDKVVAIDGTVTSIGFVDDKLWVILDDSVSCFFGGKDAERVYDEVVVGDIINVKGKGCGFNSEVSHEELSNCCLL